MIRTYMLVGVLLVGLVGAAGVAVAADSPVCADIADSEDGPVVVGETPAGTLGPGDTITLYPGSELRVLVCEGDGALDRDDGEIWNMTGQDGIYDVEETSAHSVRITVEDPGTLDLADQIEGPDPDGAFTVQSSERVVHESDLFDTEIQTDDREELDAHEQELRSATERINESITSLNDSLDTLSADADNETVADYREQLEALQNVRSDALNATDALEQELYAQALNHPEPESQPIAMNTLQDEQNTFNDETREIADESVERLEAIESELQSTVRRNVSMGLTGGLLVGIVAGVIGPWRKGKEVEDFYQVSSKNELTTDVLKLPWLAGGILLVGGLVGLFWFGIAGVIV